MANLVIPFDNNPASIAVKTASYTIPAGKYARCLINVIGAGTFTINGVTALQGNADTWTTLASTSLSKGTSGGGQALLTSTSAAPYTAAFSSDTGTDTSVITCEAWLPTGTVIAGSGTWRATVMEYNIVS